MNYDSCQLALSPQGSIRCEQNSAELFGTVQVEAVLQTESSGLVVVRCFDPCVLSSYNSDASCQRFVYEGGLAFVLAFKQHHIQHLGRCDLRQQFRTPYVTHVDQYRSIRQESTACTLRYRISEVC